MPRMLCVLVVTAGALAAQAPAAGPRRVKHAFASHHHVAGGREEALRDELDRLEAWLAIPANRAAVLAKPEDIARFHEVPAERGGPVSRQLRWHPHLVRPVPDGTWSTPVSRINGVAVPAFASAELYGPAGAAATLLEFVPLSRQPTSADDAVTVRDGFVEAFPASPGDRDPDARRRARVQVAAERELFAGAPAGKAAGPRFVTFDQLSAWHYADGLAGVPRPVRELDGRRVVMVGRVLPVDAVAAMPRFLLVRDVFGDDWGRRPHLHELVRVVAPAAARPDCTAEPVRVTGTLRVAEEREDGVLVGIYRLDAEQVEIVK